MKKSSVFNLPKKQKGLATVEFALVGSVVFLVMFSVMEVGRLLYTWGLLNEVSRQAARLGTVCMVDERNLVAGNVAQRLGSALPGLDGDNIVIDYFSDGSTPLADPEGSDFADIYYVRSRIVDYSYEMILPLTVDLSMFAPDFATTLRAESLGITSNGEVPCFP